MVYKLSVIIPVYNVENYLDLCLNSLKKQTIGFKNLELIFVDDCSTDSSYNIIKDYEKTYENISVYSTKKNSGNAGKPRNIGLKHVKTNYVNFLDPDDTVYPDAYEILYNKILETKSDFVMGTLTYKYSNHLKDVTEMIIFSDFSNPYEIWTNRKNSIDYILESDNYEAHFNSINEMPYMISHWGISSFLFDVSFIKINDILFPEYIPAEDSAFIFKSFAYSKDIHFIKKNIYIYNRVRNEKNSRSLTFNYDVKTNMGRLISYMLMFEFSKKNNLLLIFAKYYIPNKLNYFLNTFIINKNIPLKELELLFEYSYELFELAWNNGGVRDDLTLIFSLILKRDYAQLHNLVSVNNLPDISFKNIQTKIPYLNKINVAVISDSSSYNDFSLEFNAFFLKHDTWLEVFKKNSIDILFCESLTERTKEDNNINNFASEEFHENWENKIDTANLEKNKTLLEILDYCKKNSIKTIFWNKEDSAFFDNFIDVTLKFDYIFATDLNSVKKYKAKGHEQVYVLPFASQVKRYNPIQNHKRSKDVIFLRNWYPVLNEECKSMDSLFEKIIKNGYNLKILDVQSECSKKIDNFKFPKKYKKYVNKTVNQDIKEIYKESKYSFIINPITDSNSMFFKRIFELMSSNTFILSNYSKSLKNYFDENIYYLDKHDQIVLDEIKVNQISEENLYNILENHTYTERWKHILNCINFKFQEHESIVYCFYFENNNLCKIIDDFESINYLRKKCIIIKDKAISNITFKENIQIITRFDLENFFKNKKDYEYFIFRNLKQDIDNNFIKKALLHYKYLDKSIGICESENNHFMVKLNNSVSDILFNSVIFDEIVSIIIEEKTENIKIYNI